MIKKIKLIFVLPNKKKIELLVNEGESVLEIAKMNDLPIEGACGGSLACSTCHVVIDSEHFKGDLTEISDMENDLLDMVPSVTCTSRLSCQIRVTKEMDGMIISLCDSCNFCSCLNC